MNYLYSFLLGIPFSIIFFISIAYLNDNNIIFIISILICLALIRAVANPILKKLAGPEGNETGNSSLFILGLVLPLFVGLILI